MAEFSTKWLKVSEPSPNVLHVELARPPVNAFSTEYWKQYGGLFDRIAEEAPDVRALVLSSSFPKLFTAGLDLNETMIWEGASDDPARRALVIRKRILDFQHAIGAPERCPFPVIVAVHGPVFGLGVDMIAACDIRYAASNSVFSIKEVDVGLAADIGTLAFLPKITGNLSLVRELAYSARAFSAAEADKIGLVSKVIEGSRDEVVKAALDLAKFIAQKSPYAVAATKRLITHSRDHTVAENLEYTATWNSAGLQTKDFVDSIEAAKTKKTLKFEPLRKIGPKL